MFKRNDIYRRYTASMLEETTWYAGVRLLKQC